MGISTGGSCRGERRIPVGGGVHLKQAFTLHNVSKGHCLGRGPYGGCLGNSGGQAVTCPPIRCGIGEGACKQGEEESSGCWGGLPF